MGIRVIFYVVDDLDGTATPDVTKVTFGLDGQKYEIDLNTANAQRLRIQLAEYVRVARRTGQLPVSPPTLQDLRREPLASGQSAPLRLASHAPRPDWQAEDLKSA